jgi:hypothetical protein
MWDLLVVALLSGAFLFFTESLGAQGMKLASVQNIISSGKKDGGPIQEKTCRIDGKMLR